jgi:PPP family 3-phenylpropionic acid transporter
MMYAAFGAASPFLPSYIEQKGIPPEQIGIIFAVGTAIRLISAPIAGRVADRNNALRLTLAICAIAAAAAAAGYLTAWGFSAILVVSLLHAFALAPTTNLADALALIASREPRRGFEYGWVRGIGSAAFVLGSIAAGWTIPAFGLGSIIALQIALMLAVPLAASLVPPVSSVPMEAGSVSQQSIIALIRLPVFRRIVLLAALILGSHAMHDTFAVIRWTAAGVSPLTTSILWSMSVAAEVAVFFYIGPWLLWRFTPPGAIAIAAIAGAARWLVAAMTVDVGALLLIQPLHGLTFALLHLACMRLLAQCVPAELAATAQALYGTVGVGTATAILTLASGWLYAWMGPGAFVVMSMLCLAALAIGRDLRQLVSQGDTHSASVRLCFSRRARGSSIASSGAAGPLGHNQITRQWPPFFSGATYARSRPRPVTIQRSARISPRMSPM